jgi:hypothetical protein
MPLQPNLRRANFSLNQEAYLYRRGLRFAQLGLHGGGDAAYDSGPSKSKGDFTGAMDQGAWYYDIDFGRPYMFFTNSAAKVTYTFSPIVGTGPWSISAWVVPIATGGWDGPIVAWGDAGTAHNFFELNIDNSGYVHGDQAAASNSSTFVGAATPGAWNHLLYVHEDNSPVNGDTLYANGVEAAGGGVGSTVLDLAPGNLVMGESEQSSIFNIYAAVGDVMIFDQKLGLEDAHRLNDFRDPGLFGLVQPGEVFNAYDLENAR